MAARSCAAEGFCLIADLRRQFNSAYTPDKYQRFLSILEQRVGVSTAFRLSETPVFLPRDLVRRMSQYGREMVETLLANPQYRKFLDSSQAAAVLLKAADAEGFAGNALIVADPYLAYARISHLFDPKPKAVAGIHPSAVVAEDAQVDASASIGPFAVIESGARIAANVSVGAHCVVGARCVIGEGGWLAPRVTLYHDVTIGKRVVIQSGAVIGGEGFGFANEKGVWRKIAQIGGVTIGDDVVVGAGPDDVPRDGRPCLRRRAQPARRHGRPRRGPRAGRCARDVRQLSASRRAMAASSSCGTPASACASATVRAPTIACRPGRRHVHAIAA